MIICLLLFKVHENAEIVVASPKQIDNVLGTHNIQMITLVLKAAVKVASSSEVFAFMDGYQCHGYTNICYCKLLHGLARYYWNIVLWAIVVQMPTMPESVIWSCKRFVVVSDSKTCNNGFMATPIENNGHHNITTYAMTMVWSIVASSICLHMVCWTLTCLQ